MSEPTEVRHSDSVRHCPTTAAPRVWFVSGFGQYHTNEPDPEKPNKKLTPYESIDLAGIRALVDDPQSIPKEEAQWLIPSTLHSRTFKTQECSGEYWMLWADLDKEPLPISDAQGVIEFQLLDCCEFELYTSRSAQVECQKARILIPLVKPLSGTDWLICQGVLNDKLAALGMTPDRKSEGAAQLCYLPNRGDFYSCHSNRGGILFNPLSAWAAEIAEKRQAIHEAAALQIARKLAAAERKDASQLSRKDSLIDTFNNAYSVHDILLQAGYDQRGDTFRHPQSESGSYSASVKDGRVHSLSSNDPLYTGGGGVGAHDAFSAFAVLFCGGDTNKALRTAGDDWLTIDGESWNKVKQREYVSNLSAHSCCPGVGGNSLPESVTDPLASLAENILSLDSVTGQMDCFLPHYVDMWIPQDEVTLLAGHGGGGKSYVALSIAVHVAHGRPFGTLATQQTNVLFFSGEDGAPVLRQRLSRICRALSIDPLELNGRLNLLDASDIDPALHREQKVTVGGRQQIVTATSLLDVLAALVEKLQVGLVVIDNASDAYDDDEIKRARVRAFIRSLRSSIARPGRAVLLLAHINKASASSGRAAGNEDYSGSTAWHNSVRSRLSLIPDGDNALKIEHLKANLGVKAAPVRLEWHEGVPLVAGTYSDAGAKSAADISKAAERERDSGDKTTIISVVRDFDMRGELITTSVHGAFTVFKLLKPHPMFPKGMSSDRLARLLRELEVEKRLFRRTVRTPNRKWKEVFTCSTTAEDSAPNTEVTPVPAMVAQPEVRQ